jgi:L-iditol 2-dehydrogenase
MKALVKYATGPGGMEIQDIPDPVLIPGHVIIAVEACGICGTDLHIQAGEYPVNPPVVLGHELSGTVVEVAPDVTQVRIGQRVTSLVYFTTCGTCQYCQTGQWNLCAQRKSVGSGVNGAFARYVLVPARNVRSLPDNLDFISAAVTEPLACCTHAVLEKAITHPGNCVLVTGPGAIGLLTAQILLSAGVEVILAGTRADAERLELAQRLGVQHTFQVDTQPVADLIQELTHGKGVDLVFECSGAAAAAHLGIKAAKRGGQFIQIGLFGKPVEIDWDQAVLKEVDIRNSFASTWISWDYALKLLESGKVQTLPLVSDVLPIGQWESAFERFGSKQGIKFILTPEI